MKRFLYRIIIFTAVLGVLIVNMSLTPGYADESEGIYLKEKKEVLFLGGCSGTSEDGDKAPYYSYYNVRKAVEGFDRKKYDIVLKSKDRTVATTSSKKDRIYARGTGTTKVRVKVKDRTTLQTVFKGYIKVVVRKNADEGSFLVSGIEDGQNVYIGDELIVTLPGDYTDERLLYCDDDSVEIERLEDDRKSFIVNFTEAGVFDITAAAYQSETYKGFTAINEFTVFVKEKSATVTQLSPDTLLFKGGPVDGDLSPLEISVYEEKDGASIFYSYASKAAVTDDEAVIELFKCLESESEYSLQYDGLKFCFKSQPSTPKDVERIEILEDSINAEDERALTFRYYNANGMDISSSVKKELDYRIELKIKDQDEVFHAYTDGYKLCIVESGRTVTVEAVLDYGTTPDGKEGKKLRTQKVITSLPERGKTFTGKFSYTLKKTGTNGYLTWADEAVHSAPKGDSVILEAIFEMDDGSTKNLKEAGIKLLVGDMKVVMLGSETLSGGYSLILNHEGTTSIAALRGEEAVASFEITVLAERKPARISVELSKDRLNTNELVGDYLFVKADMYDQYDEPVTGKKYTVEQSELSRENAGEVVFNEISEGRFVVYGMECSRDSDQKAVTAKVESEGLNEEFKFYIRDVKYSISDAACVLKLEADGSKVLDNDPGLGREAPKSTYVVTKISKDGYYIGEGIGFLFEEKPSVRNNADYYGVEAGDCFYGITVEQTRENGEKRMIVPGENECIIPSYMDLEFTPYCYGERLEAGTYLVTVYRITAGEEMSKVEECDFLNIRVLDLEREVEIIQKAQTYSGEVPVWKERMGEFFSFIYDGEDITRYLTKVDCVEAPTGSVFIKSVDFMIINTYYGIYVKSVPVERLITKQ